MDGRKKTVKSVETNKVKIEDTYEGETLVQLSDKEKYLGDILSQDGKNHKKHIVTKK